MTNLVGELGSFNGVLQFLPLSDPGAPSSTGNVTEPQTLELSEFNSNFEDYESELVHFEGITFSDAGSDFSNGTNYDVMQDTEAGVFRSHFFNVDYIGTAIPDAANLTGIAMEFNGTTQFASRFLADMEVIVQGPVNDTCGGAQITDVEVGVVASAMGDATNGTIDNGFPVAQVWEAFTLSECADVIIDFCGSSPLATALYINIYNSCPIGTSLPTGTVTLIECAGNDSALSVSFVGLEAGTYWYPVLADIDNYGGFGAYTINYTATACPAPQPLETCELSEEVLAPSATSNAGLTGSGGSQGGSAAWYHYTPAEDGFMDVSSCLGGSDTRLWIWEGDCDNLVAVADTDDDCAFAPDGTGFEYAASLEDIPVVGGTTYYIEWDATWSAAAFDWTLNFSTTTGIEDNEIADFAIYPNPNNGQFSIVNDGVNGTYLIEIMDVTGKVVYSEQLQLNANETTVINATDVNTGVYLVKTTNTEENYYRTIRMVIK